MIKKILPKCAYNYNMGLDCIDLFKFKYCINEF